LERIPRGKYTKEFRQEAVNLVKQGSMSWKEAARQLSLPPSTLANWVKADKAGKLGNIGKAYRTLTDTETELARTRRELAVVKMERDILKKAAAYFARESLTGTRP
jgi:transposase